MNKGIPANGIEYNHMNLPTKVTTLQGNIKYFYGTNDRKGVKIAVHVSDGNTEGILKEGGSVILNKALSKAGGKAIEKSKQVGNITTKSEEKIQEGFFAAIGKFFSDAYDNITSDSKSNNYGN